MHVTLRHEDLGHNERANYVSYLYVGTGEYLLGHIS